MPRLWPWYDLWGTRKCSSRGEARLLKREQRLLARLLKVWYEEHKQEVDHDAFVVLAVSVADFWEVVEEEKTQFKKDQFIKACMP
jgi:hypothetical protein